jgi:hypothetical protein
MKDFKMISQNCFAMPQNIAKLKQSKYYQNADIMQDLNNMVY